MKNENNLLIEADSNSGRGSCRHHCWPSCHPCQTGPENVYGCRSRYWPGNREGDFVPIVTCAGDPRKCKIPAGLKKRWAGVLRRRLKKVVEAYRDIERIQGREGKALRRDLREILRAKKG